MSTDEHFHAIIVGSGFGGSVMAHRLAEAGKSVCVLERGKPYPPGSFPRSPHEMKENFWDPSRGLHGMFNVWSFRNLGAVVSSGLGGGSLIYANVLIRKDPKWFIKEDLGGGGYESWPITRQDLEPHYDNVERIIGPQQFPFDTAPYAETAKTIALRDAAAAIAKRRPGQISWERPPLAVTFYNQGAPAVPGEPINGGPNLHGRSRTTCRLCAECCVGCNYGSKNTLDYNYLTLAWQRRAQIRTRVEVRSFRPRDGGGYEVSFVRHSDDTTDTRNLPLERATCDRLILSAGAFGSTFLLLKNRANFPALSPRLGHAFSGNGDILGFAMDARDPKSGAQRVIDPTSGTVITSTLRMADALDGVGASGRGFYVQDAGLPVLAAWLAETGDVPGLLSRTIRFVTAWIRARFSRDPSTDLGPQLSALLGDGRLTRSLLPLLGMGREVPDGRMYLSENGYLALDWSLDRSEGYYDGVREIMGEIARELGAKYRDDPLWFLRRSITVHPLGGCPMGETPAAGVVNSFGEVFGYPGLYVADGSVLPGPVGPNPSLTIAACADRFATRMLGA
jgi:cholesterol oxidase